MMSANSQNELIDLRNSILKFVDDHCSNYVVTQVDILGMKGGHCEEIVKSNCSLSITCEEGATLYGAFLENMSQFITENFRCSLVAKTSHSPDPNKSGYIVDEIIVAIILR